MFMTASPVLGMLLWITLMLLAIPYVRRARHPRAQPLAAYMVFIILFSVGVVVMYAVLILLLGWADGLAMLHHPLGAAVFLLLLVGPAFLLARWQLKQPPRKPPFD